MKTRRQTLTDLLRARLMLIDLYDNCPLGSKIIMREQLTAIEQELCNYTIDEELVYTSRELKSARKYLIFNN